MSSTHARALRGSEKRALALLGVPTMALALASTVVTTYTPVVAREFVESSAVIGLIIGCEGLVALWLPLVVGAWSDRLDTRTRRSPPVSPWRHADRHWAGSPGWR